MVGLFKKQVDNKEIKYDTSFEKIAVIDTETNWNNQVMSIGIVIAFASNFTVIDKKYYIINPEYKAGGMYENVMDLTLNKKRIYIRKKAIEEILLLLTSYKVDKIFAYNASFDFRQLPELKSFYWYDIMKIAANKNFNKKIPSNLECCKNGKLKKGYGVEPMYRMLSGNCRYHEIHNALRDAEDELIILAMLNLDLSVFIKNSIVNDPKSKK